MEISLRPVESKDIPALVSVHTAAFQSDQFSNFMLLGRDEGFHQRMMTQAVEHWLADPAAELVQAVDAAGEVVGWSCCLLKRPSAPGTTSERKRESTNEQQKHTGAKPTAQSQATAKQEPVKPPPTKTPSQLLGGTMHKELVQCEDEHMGGKTYMVLQAMVTHPSHQRRGVGYKLAQWGVGRADSQALPCWTHASPASQGLYAKAGFREVGSSTFDLDEWAGERDAVWGPYTFRYMLRLAKEAERERLPQ